MVYPKQLSAIVEELLVGPNPPTPAQRMELIHAIRQSLPSLRSLLSFTRPKPSDRAQVQFKEVRHRYSGPILRSNSRTQRTEPGGLGKAKAHEGAIILIPDHSVKSGSYNRPLYLEANVNSLSGAKDVEDMFSSVEDFTESTNVLKHQDGRLSLESMQRIYTLEAELALLLRLRHKYGKSGAQVLFSMGALEHLSSCRALSMQVKENLSDVDELTMEQINLVVGILSKVWQY